jgi:hypothetical protein
MGFLGKLLGGRAPVRGRISVVNRPAETNFLFTTFFVACPAGSPPPLQGMPPEEQLEQWPRGEFGPSGTARLGDIGEEFGLSLPAGDYQVLVTALPFIVENGKVVGDPNNRFAFWPQPRALHLEGSTERLLALRVQFPKGLGKFGEVQGPRARCGEHRATPRRPHTRPGG